jgi:hypothetical protein
MKSLSFWDGVLIAVAITLIVIAMGIISQVI